MGFGLPVEGAASSLHPANIVSDPCLEKPKMMPDQPMKLWRMARRIAGAKLGEPRCRRSQSANVNGPRGAALAQRKRSKKGGKDSGCKWASRIHGPEAEFQIPVWCTEMQT